MDTVNIYEQLVDNFQEVLFVISPDWQRVHFINRSYEKVWGKSCASLLAEPLSWADSIHPEDRDFVLQTIETGKHEIIHGVTFPDYRIIRPDNTIRWISAKCFPIFDNAGNVYRVAGIAADISNRKEVETERDDLLVSLQRTHEYLERIVDERTAELQGKTEKLQEVNVALNILLAKRERDKTAQEEGIMSNIEVLVTPYLHKLQMECNDELSVDLLKIIQMNLAEITSPSARKYKHVLLKLTPTQIQVAELIKQGRSTKEIASLLRLSPSTISSHRREIRKRLSLSNEKMNLRAALLSL